MTKRLVEIDDEKLALARELAGTPTIKATVDRALDEAHRAAPPARDSSKTLRDPGVVELRRRLRRALEPRDGGDRAGRRRHQVLTRLQRPEVDTEVVDRRSSAG